MRWNTLSRLPLATLPLAALAALAALIGCAGADPAVDDEDDGCGPNSSYSEEHEHCHCDDGFEIQGTACLPVAEEEDDDDAVEALDLAGAVVTGQSTTDGQGDPVYLLQAVAGDVVLRIEGYVGVGAPQGAASVELSGAELNYATCAVCVLVETGCSAHEDHFHCNETLMPTGGNVEFETLDPAAALAGHLHEVTFQPVAIDSDFETTPVAGTHRRVTHWDFDTALQPR